MGQWGDRLVALWSHLHLVVLPVRQAQGLDLADVGDVAVDPGAGQADKHSQGAGAPLGICTAEERERDKWSKMDKRTDGMEYGGTERQMD